MDLLKYYTKIAETSRSTKHIEYAKKMVSSLERSKDADVRNHGVGNNRRLLCVERKIYFDSLSEAARYFDMSIANMSRIMKERNGRWKKGECHFKFI